VAASCFGFIVEDLTTSISASKELREKPYDYLTKQYLSHLSLTKIMDTETSSETSGTDVATERKNREVGVGVNVGYR